MSRTFLPRTFLIGYGLLHQWAIESLASAHTDELFRELSKHSDELRAYITTQALDFVLDDVVNLQGSVQAAEQLLNQLRGLLHLPVGYRWLNQQMEWVPSELEVHDLLYAHQRDLVIICSNPDDYEQAKYLRCDLRNVSGDQLEQPPHIEIWAISEFLNRRSTISLLRALLPETTPDATNLDRLDEPEPEINLQDFVLEDETLQIIDAPDDFQNSSPHQASLSDDDRSQAQYLPESSPQTDQPQQRREATERKGRVEPTPNRFNLNRTDLNRFAPGSDSLQILVFLLSQLLLARMLQEHFQLPEIQEASVNAVIPDLVNLVNSNLINWLQAVGLLQISESTVEAASPSPSIANPTKDVAQSSNTVTNHQATDHQSVSQPTTNAAFVANSTEHSTEQQKFLLGSSDRIEISEADLGTNNSSDDAVSKNVPIAKAVNNDSIFEIERFSKNNPTPQSFVPELIVSTPESSKPSKPIAKPKRQPEQKSEQPSSQPDKPQSEPSLQPPVTLEPQAEPPTLEGDQSSQQLANTPIDNQPVKPTPTNSPDDIPLNPDPGSDIGGNLDDDQSGGGSNEGSGSVGTNPPTGGSPFKPNPSTPDGAGSNNGQDNGQDNGENSGQDNGQDNGGNNGGTVVDPIPCEQPNLTNLPNPNGSTIFQIQPGKFVISGFVGTGRGINPTPEVIENVDTLQLTGAGLTPENMLLNQNGNDVVISFETSTLEITLKDFTLDHLDNLTTETWATVEIGNVLFDGQTTIQDSFDVINAEQSISQVIRTNTVTFLNSLSNQTSGYENSNDVIDGLTGNDLLWGLSGNDKLRGGEGDDHLYGGAGDDYLLGGIGNDRLESNTGNDTLIGGTGQDQFVLSPSVDTATVLIQDFQVGIDWISFTQGIDASQISVQINGNNTLLLFNNQPFATLLGIQLNSLSGLEQQR